MEMTKRLIAAALCLGAAWPTQAGEIAEPTVAQPRPIAYLSGGIGQDDVDAMHAAADQYNLRLTFSATEGNYLSDVHVTIRDSRGRTVLEADSAGPLLYAFVPAGRYTVTADAMGRAIDKAVTVSGKRGTEAYFRWKLPE